MWILAVYLMDRRPLGATWIHKYEKRHYAEAKAQAVIRNGFGCKEEDGASIYYPAHQVDYVAIRKAPDVAEKRGRLEG